MIQIFAYLTPEWKLSSGSVRSDKIAYHEKSNASVIADGRCEHIFAIYQTEFNVSKGASNLTSICSGCD